MVNMDGQRKRFAIILLIVLFGSGYDRVEVSMPHDLPTAIIPTPERSEIQKFADWFFQDWYLAYPDFHTGAQMHVDSLSPERRAVLAQELREFLREHTGETPDELREAWFLMGAGAWPRDLHLADFISHFVSVMEGGVE